MSLSELGTARVAVAAMVGGAAIVGAAAVEPQRLFGSGSSTSGIEGATSLGEIGLTNVIYRGHNPTETNTSHPRHNTLFIGQLDNSAGNQKGVTLRYFDSSDMSTQFECRAELKFVVAQISDLSKPRIDPLVITMERVQITSETGNVLSAFQGNLPYVPVLSGPGLNIVFTEVDEPIIDSDTYGSTRKIVFNVSSVTSSLNPAA